MGKVLSGKLSCMLIGLVQDGSRSLGLFLKGKTHNVAELHYTDLDFWVGSGEWKPCLTGNQIWYLSP